MNKYLEERTTRWFPEDKETYLLFMEILESLKSFTESVRADSDNGYVNLKYQDFINFLIKVSIFTNTWNAAEHDSLSTKLLVDKHNSELLKLLSEIDNELELRHIFELSKVEKYYTGNPLFYIEFPDELKEELTKIHIQRGPIEICESFSNRPPIRIDESYPTRHNHLGYPFYFIFVGGDEWLNFKYFKSLPMSLFLHIPDRDIPDRRRSLQGHLDHDLGHFLSYLDKILNINIIKLITSNSTDKYSQIENELLRNAIEQGATWDGLEEFFETSDVQTTGLHLNLFIHDFFYKQHEVPSVKHVIRGKTFQNDYSPHDPQSLVNFLIRLLMDIQPESLSYPKTKIRFYVAQLVHIVQEKIAPYEHMYLK